MFSVKILILLFLPVASVIYVFLLIYDKITNNGIIRYLTCRIIDKTQINKLTWFKIFKKYNIPTPKVYATMTKNKKLQILDNNFNINKDYIFKPINGIQGRNIIYDSYNNIKMKNIKINEPMIIQERVYDCKYGSSRSRHFRINTYYNKKTNNSYLINFFMMTSGKGKLTSNLHFWCKYN